MRFPRTRGRLTFSLYGCDVFFRRTRINSCLIISFIEGPNRSPDWWGGLGLDQPDDRCVAALFTRATEEPGTLVFLLPSRTFRDSGPARNCLSVTLTWAVLPSTLRQQRGDTHSVRDPFLMMVGKEGFEPPTLGSLRPHALTTAPLPN